jgi:hypothetical protein
VEFKRLFETRSGLKQGGFVIFFGNCRAFCLQRQTHAGQWEGAMLRRIAAWQASQPSSKTRRALPMNPIQPGAEPRRRPDDVRRHARQEVMRGKK